MKRVETHCSGFSLPTVLIAVAAVVVIGAVGSVTYKHDHHKTTNLNAATSSTSQTTTKSKTQSTDQAATTATQYLDITQWGVELPLTSSISDSYYVVSKSSSSDPDGLPSAVWLGLSSLTSSSCNPANNNNGGSGAIGAIDRIPPTATDPVTGKLYTQEFPNGTTIGSYYYAYQSLINDPNNKCPQSSTQSADSAFATAAQSTVSVSTTSTTSN